MKSFLFIALVTVFILALSSMAMPRFARLGRMFSRAAGRLKPSSFGRSFTSSRSSLSSLGSVKPASTRPSFESRFKNSRAAQTFRNTRDRMRPGRYRNPNTSQNGRSEGLSGATATNSGVSDSKPPPSSKPDTKPQDNDGKPGSTLSRFGSKIGGFVAVSAAGSAIESALGSGSEQKVEDVAGSIGQAGAKGVFGGSKGRSDNENSSNETEADQGQESQYDEEQVEPEQYNEETQYEDEVAEEPPRSTTRVGNAEAAQSRRTTMYPQDFN